MGGLLVASSCVWVTHHKGSDDVPDCLVFLDQPVELSRQARVLL